MPPPSQSNGMEKTVSLELSQLYKQLYRETACDPKSDLVIQVPKVSTGAEVTRIIATQLQNDKAKVWLSTLDEKRKSRQRVRDLAIKTKEEEAFRTDPSNYPEADDSKPSSKWMDENTKPIMTGSNVPPLSVPARSSPEAHARIKSIGASEWGQIHLISSYTADEYTEL